MRMIIIAVIALLVLGGGGAGAYFYFMKPAEAAATAESSEVGDNHKKAEKEAGKGGHGAVPQYVELSPLILPIVGRDGVTQTVSLVISLEVPSPEAAAKVQSMTPRLNDAYIQDMYGILSDQAALKGGVIQVGLIKSRLNKISTEMLGDDVNEVLLQVVQQRPI